MWKLNACLFIFPYQDLSSNEQKMFFTAIAERRLWLWVAILKSKVFVFTAVVHLPRTELSQLDNFLRTEELD